MTTRLVILWILACAVGCVGGVSGELDGTGPAPMQSGYWYAFENDGRVAVHVALRSYGGACDVDTLVLEGQTDAHRAFQEAVSADASRLESARNELGETYDELDREHLPPAYWSAAVFVNADDEDDIVEERHSIPGEAAFQVCDQQDYNDYERVFAGESGGYERDCYVADDGVVFVDAYVKDESIAGGGDAEMVEANDRDDEVGEVSFSFNVPYCEPMEDAVRDSVPLTGAVTTCIVVAGIEVCY